MAKKAGKTRGLEPFADEAASVGIGDLTIENGLDRVALYGDLDLTKDKAGLERARELRDLLAAVVEALEAEAELPDHVPPLEKGTDEVDNPFT